MADETYEGWAILELMGHRRLAGYVREVELAGTGMIRLDIPKGRTVNCTCGSSDPDSISHEDHRHDCALFQDEDGPPVDVQATQFYSPSALYCLTPTTEAIARQIAVAPTPVHRFELPSPPSPAGFTGDELGDAADVEVVEAGIGLDDEPF